MTDQLDGRDDLTSGIFGDFEYVLPQMEPKEFKPWHKPRKQFVRREQLSALLLRLYETREPGDPLRYLGLPGTDLIDLRYLHEQLCRKKDRQLSFLGFNTEAQPGNSAHVQLNISLDEVVRLPGVDPQSLVLLDDFRLVGNKNSVAWSRAKKLGPFDIVNIDLCNGLASEPPQKDGSIYNALAQLMTLQTRKLDPWLLLISSRIGRGKFDADAEQKLFDVFRRNVAKCKGFAEMCMKYLNLDVQSIDLATCSEGDLLNLMPAAIGKWLSALGQGRDGSRVELASTQGYQVDPCADREDLVSLALRFDPVIEAPTDVFFPTPPAPVDECKTAKNILKRSARRLNVDTILKEEPEMKEELITETEQLLALARYKVADYRSWLTSSDGVDSR